MRRIGLHNLNIITWIVLVMLQCQVSWSQTHDSNSVQALALRLENAELRLLETEHRLMQTENELRRARTSANTDGLSQTIDQSFAQENGASLENSDLQCEACEFEGETCDGDSVLSGLAWEKPGKWKVTPFGKLEAEMILANDATVSQNYIVFAVPQEAIRTDQIDITGQSTQVGLDIAGPKLGNFKVGGLILMDFHGNRPSRNEPGAYFIRGYGELVNENWRFAFGQMGDTIEGFNAEVVNWQGLGGLGYIGANQRGTFRVDRFFNPEENQLDAYRCTDSACCHRSSRTSGHFRPGQWHPEFRRKNRVGKRSSARR